MSRIKIIRENPTILTASQFKELVTENPDWALTVTRPTEILGTVVLIGSKIRHLSPLLSFRPSEQGQDGIPDIRLVPKEKFGTAADFRHCDSLRVAAGTFHGFANFWNSRVEKIDPGFTVTKANGEDNAADFRHCPNLKTARGKYAGKVSFGPGIEVVEDIDLDDILVRNETYIAFENCEGIRKCPEELLLNPKVIMHAHIRRRLLAELAGRRAMKQPDLLLE